MRSQFFARQSHCEQAVAQSAQQSVLKPQASEGDATSQLRLAAGAGDEAGVAAELARGARVDAADAGGQTALYKAANLGKTAIVKLLVDGGADVNKINQKVRSFPTE
jgi:ankyrin repeat protein